MFEAIAGFAIPRGIRVKLSSLATPHFASSYQLGTVAMVDGSITYLYSNVRLGPVGRSETVRLQDLLRGCRVLSPLAQFPRIVGENAEPELGGPCGSDALGRLKSLVTTGSEPVRERQTDNPEGKENTTSAADEAHQPPSKIASTNSTPHQAQLPGPTTSSPPDQKSGNDTPESTSHCPSPSGDSSTAPTTPSLASAVELVATALNETIDTVSTRYRRIRWAEDSLIYGRMYLPSSRLEALILRRITPNLQGQLRAVSQDSIKNGGTILGLLQYDTGKFGVEGLASTDGGLLGLRGLYNFGGDASRPHNGEADSESHGQVHRGHGQVQNNGGGGGSARRNHSERERIYGRSSIGGEIYYGTLNKSGGISLGARFSTLPSNLGIPLTATATCNPLMGNLSCTYAVMAGPDISIASKFDWNVYSYESDWVFGVEMWRRREIRPTVDVDAVLGRRKASRVGEADGSGRTEENRGVDSENIMTLSPAKAGVSVSGDAGSNHNKTNNNNIPTWSGSTTFQPPTSTASKKPAQLFPEWQHSERSRPAKLQWKTDQEVVLDALAADEARLRSLDPHVGVLKARLDQHLRVGLVWEGRMKSMVFSVGAGLDLRRPDAFFRTMGLEVGFFVG